jgi:hypothetical protein
MSVAFALETVSNPRFRCFRGSTPKDPSDHPLAQELHATSRWLPACCYRAKGAARGSRRTCNTCNTSGVKDANNLQHPFEQRTGMLPTTERSRRRLQNVAGRCRSAGRYGPEGGVTHQTRSTMCGPFNNYLSSSGRRASVCPRRIRSPIRLRNRALSAQGHPRTRSLGGRLSSRD